MTSARPATPLLEAQRIVRRYGARTVLDIESLSVQSGEVLGIVGPNGAGKSTLFRTLLLLERPDAGEIRLDGVPMKHGDARARGRLAGVFQRPVLFTGTVQQNVAFGLRSAGVTGERQRQRVATALEWLELGDLASRRVQTLSGGEAQRVALARALVLEPEILLLDEPTSSLDISVRRRFRQDLETVARKRAGSIVLITHDATEAFGLADRIAVMHDGRIAQAGTPDEIMLRPGTPFVAELTGAELLLHGVVEAVEDGLASIRVSEQVVLWAALSGDSAVRKGTAAAVAYRPEDVSLAPGGTELETSAINRIGARVEAVVPAGALTRVRIRAADGILLTALLTRRSVAALGLSQDSPVIAHIKAAALHVWPRDTS
ncbi:MAG TPA: ABC transporter ATP-binding protein [Longimicrobiales bacterium]|nr:ABC transporter ATP-binding protein [Longimicrobiales bacterium]